MARILIFGTEEGIARKLSQAMQKEGYQVQICDAIANLPAPLAEPTLIILDARMKWSVCRPLFSAIQAVGYPVLFLTADKEMTTHLRALYRGQSDVLMIPFSRKPHPQKQLRCLGIRNQCGSLPLMKRNASRFWMANVWN